MNCWLGNHPTLTSITAMLQTASCSKRLRDLKANSFERLGENSFDVVSARSYEWAVNTPNLKTSPSVFFLDQINKTVDPMENISHIGKMQKFLKLNVGGTPFRLLSKTVVKRTNACLLYKFMFLSHSERLEIADGYIEETDEYFFERPSPLFEVIYLYYVTGECHRPRSICLDILLSELAFWNLTQVFLADCCWQKHDPIIPNGHVESQEDEFQKLPYGSIRRKIWNLIEVPESSSAARVFSFCSILAVLISNLGLVLGSIPEYHVKFNRTVIKSDNLTEVVQFREPHHFFELIEYLCVAWFSTEYLSKIIVAANRKKVCCEILNIIDLIAILPFYFELCLHLVGYSTEQLEDLKGALLVVRILRVLRVIRIFKLGRYSSGLRAFAKTLHASKEQLSMLGVVLSTGIMFFSTLVYFLEKDEPSTHFHSIPAAFWWCIVTMTTVGYGDVVPTTLAGKLVASGAIACGVLVLALPITIIVDNFMKVQQDTQSLPAGHPFMRSKESNPYGSSGTLAD